MPHGRSFRNMSPRSRFFFTRIFPLIFLLAGGGALVFGVRGLLRARASAGWPHVEGEVVSSSVETHRGSGRNSSTTYHAEVHYTYEVNGRTYDGNRVAYGDYGSSSPSHARRIVNRYPAGTEVTVHYRPDDPEQCVLEPGMKLQAWFVPGLGLVFFGVGAAMAVFLPRLARKKTAPAEGAATDEPGSAPEQ